MNVQIDWLQMHYRGAFSESPLFTLDPKILRTKIFNEVRNLYYRKQLIGTLARFPLSGILHPDTVIIKIDNRLLYTEDIPFLVTTIMNFSGLRYIGLSRFDLCYDFHSFENFRDPANVIKGIINGDLIRIRCDKSQVRFKTGKNARMEYLRMGANDSPRAVYLYRKDIEMKEAKFKPYIYNQWKEHGLSTSVPIWRMEFTFKGNNHNIFDKSTGQCEKIDIKMLFEPLQLTRIFSASLNQLFDIRIQEKKKRSNQLKKIKTFTFNIPAEKLITITEEKDLTRSDRIFIKKMENFNCELREKRTDLSFYMSEIVSFFADQRGLKKYRQFILNNSAS